MKIIFTFTILLLSIQSVYSIGVTVTDSNELMGCWERTIYPDDVMTQMSKQDFYHPELQKYQWFCFFENNVFRVVTSNKKEVHTTQELKSLYNSMPAPMSWKWVTDGVVNVKHADDSSLNAHWIVTRIEKDMHVFGNNLIPKNSLFMAIPTQDLQNFVTVRVLRNINDKSVKSDQNP